MKTKTLGSFHFDNVFRFPPTYNQIVLYQVGDLACTPGNVVLPHTQFCYEISYIVSGKGVYVVDGKSYELKAGDTFVNLPGQVHEIRADSEDPFRYFYIGFGFSDPDDTFREIRSFFDRLTNPVMPDISELEQSFLGLCAEFVNNSPLSEVIIRAYMEQIIAYTWRAYSKLKTAKYNPTGTTRDCSHLVYDVISYIDANILTIRELGDIAAHFGYSYSYLSHIFSRIVGVSIKEYYTSRRFEKASLMLLKNHCTITETAEALGYQSVHSFSKAFKNYYGVSPSEHTAK